MIRIEKTHAKDRAGLYKAGEIYEDNEVESLAYKLENGLVKRYKPKTKTKEEKKTRRRRTK